MKGAEIIQAVIEDRPQNGWAIFRHSKWHWFLGIIFRFLYFLIPLGVAIIFFWEFFQTGDLNTVSQDDQIMGGFMLFVALMFGFSFMKHLLSVFHIKTNMIILTNDRLVKSWKGKIVEYPYNKITKVDFYNLPGHNQGYHLLYKSYIEFTDTRDNLIVSIGRDDYFENINDISTILRSKLT